MGAKYIAILNSDDLNNNEVHIKNNSTKEEDVISLDVLIYYLDEKLNAGDDCDCGCGEECDCGCQEGLECTCGHECHCGTECDCHDDEYACNCGDSCNCCDDEHGCCCENDDGHDCKCGKH